MPARRLPWVKLWPELMEREKVRRLSDSQYRTWTYCLLAGSQQPTRWRFQSLQHAAYVTRRPIKDVQALADHHFLDAAEDGVWIHDAHEYQDIAPSDVGREGSANGPPNPPRTPDDHSRNGRGTLVEDTANARENSASRTRGETEKGEGRGETENSVSNETGKPQLRVIGEPMPKPERKPTPVGTLIDKIRAIEPGIPIYGDQAITGKKLRENPDVDLDLVAEAYVSFRHGEWQGSKMLRESGQLAWVIGDVGGYVAWRAAQRQSRRAPATDEFSAGRSFRGTA